jgi:hypothetical protein
MIESCRLGQPFCATHFRLWAASTVTWLALGRILRGAPVPEASEYDRQHLGGRGRGELTDVRNYHILDNPP